MSFKTKVVLVTGASSGIGSAIAIKFSEQGANVALIGRNEERLKNVHEKCEKVGGRPYVIVADVSDDDDVKRIVADTIKKFGKLDVLVNNAAMGMMTTIDAENTMEVFDKMNATNLRAVVNIVNQSIKHLIETKGNIINISSIASIAPSPAFVYGTLKAGLDHFSRCIALELAPKGIRVNNVNPGPVKTSFMENMGFKGAEEEQIWESMKKMTALNRYGEPEEIADLVLFLASDKARSITGSTFVSDNGTLLKGLHN